MEISKSEQAYAVLKSQMTSDVEEVWAIALTSNLTLIETKMIFRGTANACLLHPRDIFRFACITNACHLILAHNHPSGETRPSTQDIEITNTLISAGKLLQIPVIDHLILTTNSYLSMAEKGYFIERHQAQKVQHLTDYVSAARLQRLDLY